MSEKLPVIAIVGRPNVGKSALFNAILKHRISIVHEQCGVTRDSIVAPAEYRGQAFTLVDTGGLGTLNRERNVDLFDGMIREQVSKIVEEANALIWVLNSQEGITVQDEEVADFLRKSGKPVVLCANKADNQILAKNALAEFAALGFEDIKPTSCTHTSGIDDLMDKVLTFIPKVEVKEEKQGLRIAVVGRPNSGKSSLVNRILGEERVMVSEIAGTTRDAIDIPITLKKDERELPIILVDTAGLRRKRQIDTVVEFFSANRTEKAIRSSDLVLFMIDSLDPCSTQERRIGKIITDANKPCIMLANKVDLLTEKGMKINDLLGLIRAGMPFMEHAPLQAISALTGYNCKNIFDSIERVSEQMKINIPTSVFNQFLEDIQLRNPPTSKSSKQFRIYYGTMLSNPPAKFILFVNDRKLCPTNYHKYLENQIRNAFFPESGIPVIVILKEREREQRTIPTKKAPFKGKQGKQSGTANRARGAQKFQKGKKGK